jgi:uncharacterized protein (TIGR03437 family)
LAAFSGCLHAQTVRFQTTLGGIDVVLTPNITPMTVANFMAYVNSGAYTNSLIHRSLSPNVPTPAPPYIIQGGGYVLDGSLPVLYQMLNPPVTNEFNLANCPNMACNVLGTLAMALSSGIDTGQNQWFFNLSDNSTFFDGGDYTVFGNIANDASVAVANAINALPTYAENYGQDANFMDLPLNNYTCCGSVPKSDNFVLVNSITPIQPVISSAGVADAATAASISKTGISPGEILTLYGQNFGKNPAAPSYLGPTQLTTKTETIPGIVDTSLEGTQVLFNGIPGPMIFTSDGQIAAVVPYEIANQSTVSVVVSYLGQQTSPIQFNVVPVTPGLFTLNDTGQGDGAIVRYSDGTLIGVSNPAAPGDILELYGEGYGVASPNTSLPDGTIVTTTLPLPAATTVLLIDGQPVNTLYAGGAGDDFNGKMQINFTLPQLKAGPHSIQIQVGGVKSQAGVNLQTM